MKRLILCFFVATNLLAATQMKIENGVLVNQLDANNQKIVNVPAPTNPSEAANKAYVDSNAGGGGGTGLPIMGGHAGQALFTDGVIAFWQLVPWASISGKPTTLAGYGITDPIVLTTGSYANPSWITSLGWGKISGTPTTLGGYGIATPLPISAIPTGTSNTTVAIGNDSRFSANVTGLRKSSGNGSTDVAAIPGTDYVVPGAAGAGDVYSNTATSVVGEIATFADTGGKLVGRSTGIATLSSGVLGSTATIGVTQGGTGQTTINTGDITYGSATNTVGRLAGNTTTTPMYLRSLGVGGAATAPSWVQIPFADLASKPTTISGYGITDAQPLDGDLTSIAGIATTGVIPYRSAANTWGTVTIGSGLSFASGTLSATGGAGAGDVVGPSSSSDSEIAIFSGTTGKVLKRASATVTGTGLPKIANGVISMAGVNTDYGVPSLSTFNNSGTTTTPTNWPSGKTIMLQSVAQDANYYSLLPPANAYAPGTVILYGDGATLLNYGRGFRPSGSDTLNGQSNSDMATAGTWLTPFIAGGVWGQGTYQFLSNGSNAWISLFANARADRISDSSDAQKYITFDVSNQPNTGTHNIARFANTGDSSTVARLVDPTVGGGTAQRPFVSAFDETTGVLATQFVRPADLSIQQYDVNAGAISGGTATVSPTNGTVDSVRISATLTAPLTIYIPSSLVYDSGEPITIFDAAGSISSTNPVTLASLGTDTFNGNPTVTINAPYSTLTLRSNHTGNWSYPIPGSTSPTTPVSPFIALTDAATITKACDPTVNQQNWKLTSTTGIGNTRNLNITGARDGEQGTIEFTHNSSGGDTLVILNARTPNGGAGVLNLSTGANMVDVIEWRMIGTKVTVNHISLNETAAAVLTCSNAGTISGTAGTGFTSIGNTNARKYVASRFTASTANHSDVFCTLKSAIFKSGSVAAGTQLTLYIYDDTGTGPAATPHYTSGPVDVSAISPTDVAGATATPTSFSFSGNTALTNGTNYYLVFGVSAVGSTSNHFSIVNNSTGSQPNGASADGVTWTTGTSAPWNWQPFY